MMRMMQLNLIATSNGVAVAGQRPTSRRKLGQLAVCLAAVAMVVIYLSVQGIECAPNGGNNGANRNNNNENNNANSNRLLRPGLLSQLFRRQTSNSKPNSNSSSNSGRDNDNAAAASNDSPISSADSDADPGTQTELDAQKFMDSLPGAGNTNSGPSSFRERVSESWGVLRDGVSNQFKSLRENWSETVEDLRDTWTGSSE